MPTFGKASEVAGSTKWATIGEPAVIEMAPGLRFTFRVQRSVENGHVFVTMYGPKASRWFWPAKLENIELVVKAMTYIQSIIQNLKIEEPVAK